MKITAFGRSQRFLNCLKKLVEDEHEIGLIFTDEPAPGYRIGIKEYVEFADSIDAELIVTRKINHHSVLSKIREYGPDIGVSAAWLTLLGSSLIDLFPFGILRVLQALCCLDVLVFSLLVSFRNSL